MNDNRIYRFFLGQTSMEENELLATWLKESPENQSVFNEEYKLFLITRVAIESNVASDSNIDHGAKRKRLDWKKALFAAACIAAIVTFGVFGIVSISKNQEVPMSHFVAEAGRSCQVALPDGSIVILNSCSTIEFPAKFTKNERRVKLDGEAMFYVTHDAKHPFVVETYAFNIKVLGTCFDVVADETTTEFKTALLEGNVEIQNKKGKTLTQLIPDQGIEFTNNQLVKSKIDEDDYLWTEGVISIAGMSFREMMHKMERCYGVKISIDRSEDPVVHYDYLKLRISDGFDAAIKVLQRRSDFVCKYDSATNTYHIN